MNANYSFYLKSRAKNTELAIIYIKIISQNKRFFLSTNIEIPKKYFCSKSASLIKNFKDYYTINNQFLLYKNRCDEFFLKLNVNDEPFYKKKLIEFLKGKQIDKHCFYEMIDAYLSYNTDLGIKRMQRYRTLKKTLQFKFKHLFVEDITHIELHQIQQHFTIDYNNCKNTAFDKIKMVLAVLHYAEKLDIPIRKNIKFYKTKYEPVQREFLEIEQLKIIIKDVFDINNNIQNNYKNVLKYFLFSCFTGLRYSDLYKVAINKDKYIKNNIIQIIQEKTNKPVSIPLCEQAKFLLENGSLDVVYCHGRTNKYLKEILKEMNVTKKITFHNARHSFASNSIIVGIPVEILKELLGHVELRNTMKYLHVMEHTKIKEMSKFDNYL